MERKVDSRSPQLRFIYPTVPQTSTRIPFSHPPLHKTQKYLFFLNLLALYVGSLATDCSAF